MSNITQFFGTSQKKQNRQIFVGVQTNIVWTVPATTTEVEVHCWGGGGNGGGGTNPPGTGSSGAGGGGGGYVRHIYPVVSGDQLLINVGNIGGTSSVSCPTQSPSSPISATGGSPGVFTPFPGLATAGVGGTGTFSIRPGVSTSFTFAARGGDGILGGGSAGSHLGTGGNGSSGGGGGGIGGPGFGVYGGPSGLNVGSTSGWFYVDQIGGSSNMVTTVVPATAPLSPTTYSIFNTSDGCGGSAVTPATPSSFKGGFLAGGAVSGPVTTSGPGGIAGGGAGAGGPSPAATISFGGVGCVIIYW